ncbi:hypothetical protein J2T57_001356 [Natronocella acetinitrilica]|uniref:Uncharacterized protein n=1 Tax=Natronocella acetinitrilica TaxID=414046 RepID=A0AAE3KB15_9GAMM|nr:hypothetical protein [Natronocella acetinitrilica]MCP1674254.1 hypothetical protein [Natronocella acetinitrilica]
MAYEDLNAAVAELEKSVARPAQACVGHVDQHGRFIELARLVNGPLEQGGEPVTRVQLKGAGIDLLGVSLREQAPRGGVMTLEGADASAQRVAELLGLSGAAQATLGDRAGMAVERMDVGDLMRAVLRNPELSSFRVGASAKRLEASLNEAVSVERGQVLGGGDDLGVLRRALEQGGGEPILRQTRGADGEARLVAVEVSSASDANGRDALAIQYASIKAMHAAGMTRGEASLVEDAQSGALYLVRDRAGAPLIKPQQTAEGFRVRRSHMYAGAVVLSAEQVRRMAPAGNARQANMAWERAIDVQARLGSRAEAINAQAAAMLAPLLGATSTSGPGYIATIKGDGELRVEIDSARNGYQPDHLNAANRADIAAGGFEGVVPASASLEDLIERNTMIGVRAEIDRHGAEQSFARARSASKAFVATVRELDASGMLSAGTARRLTSGLGRPIGHHLDGAEAAPRAVTISAGSAKAGLDFARRAANQNQVGYSYGNG